VFWFLLSTLESPLQLGLFPSAFLCPGYVAKQQKQPFYCNVFWEGWLELPSVKLTACTWNWMVGRQSFPLGWPIFRGYVSFMEGNWDLTKFHLSPSIFNGCWLCWWIQFFQSPYHRSAVGYNMVGFTGLVLRRKIRMNWFAGSRWLSLSFEEASGSFILSYSWWKESCTIWDVNNGINYQLVIAWISEPSTSSTVCPDPKTSKKCWVLLRSSWASKEFVAAKGGLNSIFSRGGTLPVVVEVVGCTNILEYHPWKLKHGTRKSPEGTSSEPKLHFWVQKPLVFWGSS